MIRSVVTGAVVLLLAAGAARAQSIGAAAQARGYTFGPGVDQTIRQVVVPAAVTVSAGRLSAGLAGSWARTSLTIGGNPAATLSGVTDTEARIVYEIREGFTSSLTANLPTGQRPLSDPGTEIDGATASNLFPMPVTAFSTGLRITGGLAGVRRSGELTIAAAVGARWSASYTPYDDLPVEYEPGTEVRAHLAAHVPLLVGRLALGATVSTFATDQLTTSAGPSATVREYGAGVRMLFDGAYDAPLAGGHASLYGWFFRRGESEGGGTPLTGSAEDIVATGVRWRLPPTGMLRLVPSIEVRQGRRGGALAGRIASATIDLTLALSERLSIDVSGRADRGFVTQAGDARPSVKGWGVGLALKQQL